MFQIAESLVWELPSWKQKMCVVHRRPDKQRIPEWMQTPHTRLFEDVCSTLFASFGHFFIAQRTKRWIDEGLGCCSPGPEP